jgi:meso-butanediol dehydrogenase/(S,S)-butanediol dehydrogenase/diacetyl reductase
MSGRLQGKSALITGGASGMGRATSVLFAKEGARVAVLDFNEEGGRETVCQIKDAGGEAIFLRANLESEDEVRAAVETTAETFGGLNVLVNNAGIVLMAGAADTSLEDWDHILAVNLRGGFLCSRSAIPHMRKAGGGAIVSIASIGALVAVPAHGAYNASKAGILGLIRSIAIDYGPDNIRANAICPTATDTPLIRGAGAGRRALKALAQMHPLRRIAQPEDIAYAALFLASDEARCITGAVLPVDAGWTAM